MARPRNWLFQLSGRPQGPIRISQKFAGYDDCVRLSANDDVLGLNGRCDHPDRTGKDVGFPPYLLRKLRLITRTDGNLCMQYIAARRAVDQVCSKFLQVAGEFNRLLNIPAAIDPIGRRNTHEQRCSLWPSTSNAGNPLPQSFCTGRICISGPDPSNPSPSTVTP